MTVIARDAVASDHLVYAWPFPIGPECEVSCADDEQVVMCPAWLVGDRLGPGRHHWRTPDPTRPVAAFFVLTAPVEVSFDVTTMFLIPTTGQPVRIRAIGSLQVRCADPGLLIAQFVGLPFDHVNEGITRSVSRSVERMLARLLTRRVVMAATPQAVTDPVVLGGIVEELVAYNPAAGAVFGVELIRMGPVEIAADDGSSPFVVMPARNLDYSGGQPRIGPNGDTHRAPPPGFEHLASHPDIPLLETVRGTPPGPAAVPAPTPPHKRAQTAPPLGTASGEIIAKGTNPSDAPAPAPAAARPATPAPVPTAGDDITQPGMQPVKTPAPGAIRNALTPDQAAQLRGTPPAGNPKPSPAVAEARGAIMGIGISHVGHGETSAVASGEIATKVPPGGRVLVPGPNGLMQSATVRQLLQGYYELEVGSSGETIWVPIGGVVPES
jgi:hypothetical protein